MEGRGLCSRAEDVDQDGKDSLRNGRIIGPVGPERLGEPSRRQLISSEARKR